MNRLVWRKLDRFENAIECYTRELVLSQPNPKTLNNRSYCYAKLGRFNEAIADYSQALLIDAKNIHALHNRGICYERVGLFRNVSEFNCFPGDNLAL